MEEKNSHIAAGQKSARDAAGQMEREWVTVVIPVLNREKLLERTLDSVYDQSWRPIHVIVADNGSSDLSRRVAERWGAAHRSDDFRMTLTDETIPGAAAARARGLSLTGTAKVCFFDSDDTMRPRLIELAMGAFTPGVKLVHWKALYHACDGRTHTAPFTDTPDHIRLLEFQIAHSLLTTTFYMVDTGFLRSAGGWDPAVMGWDDWELGIRMLARLTPDDKVAAIPRILTDQWQQEVSITGLDFSSKAGRWEQAIDAAETTLRGAGNLSPKSQRRLLRMLAVRRAILAANYRREGHAGLAAPLMRRALGPLPWHLRVLVRCAHRYAAMGGRGVLRLLSPLL